MHEKILIKDKKGLGFEFCFNPPHHTEQLVACFVKIEKLTLPPEHGGSGTKITANRTAHGRDQDGCSIFGFFTQRDTHDPGSVPRRRNRMPDRRRLVLPEKLSKPLDAVSFDNMVRINYFMDILLVGHMSAHNNRCIWLVLSDKLAHPFELSNIRYNGTDAHNVIGTTLKFFDKPVLRGKVQEGAGGVDIRLKQHQSKGPVKHAKGKGPLCSSDLILIKLHGIDLAASIDVVLGIGPKNA